MKKPSKRRAATAKGMAPSLERRARERLRLPYSRILVAQEEGGFTAEILEFPGCFAEGETAEEANRNLENAAEGWLLACWETGQTIPEPLVRDEITGRFALRLPRSLYARAAKAASRDGVSLNQFITNAVAERVGAAGVVHAVQVVVSEFRRAASLLWLPRLEGVAATSGESAVAAAAGLPDEPGTIITTAANEAGPSLH